MKNNFIAAIISTLILSTASTSSFAATDNGHSPASPAAKENKIPEGMVDNPLIKDAPLASDFVLGKKDAPVTIVEYASLSCPHCAAFANGTLPELEKKYIETGKVKYVLRQFPLNEPAFGGAMLVNCVGAKDSAKYYLFAKVLFAEQTKWAFDATWRDSLAKFASVGGVSSDEFEACLADKDLETKLLQSKKDAIDVLKVPHTPFFYINSEVYNGGHAIEDISKVIDAKLAKK